MDEANLAPCGKPIQGLETVPLVSFMEAVDRMKEVGIPDLAAVAVGCKAHIQSQRAQGELPDGPDDEQACAICLYTAAWDSWEDSFYAKMNTILRSEDRPNLTPYMRMLKLIVAGLCNRPPFVGCVWRGVKKNLLSMYPKGSRVTWWGFSSTTLELSALQSDLFLGKTGKRTLFSISLKHGFNIKPYSFYPSEAEILIPPGIEFEVVDTLDVGHDAHIIQLREVEPPSILSISVPAASPQVSTVSTIDLSGTWQQHTHGDCECFFVFQLAPGEVPDFTKSGMQPEPGEWKGYRGTGVFDPQPGFNFTKAFTFDVVAWLQPSALTYTIFWGEQRSSSTMKFALPLAEKARGVYTNWHGDPGSRVRGEGDCDLVKL